MATTQVSTSVLKDGSVTSAKLDTNIAIDGNLTVDTNTLHVDSASNRVGIGTTSPASILDIQSNSSLAIRLGNSLGVNGYQLKSNVSSSNDFGFVIEDYLGTDLYQIQAGSAGFHRFLIDGSEKIRITWNGNLGIGTTSPTFKLELFGGSGAATYDLFRGYAWNGSANKRLDIQLDNTEADPLVIYNATRSGGSSVSHSFQVDSSEKMRINSSGNVGIGETNPSVELVVSSPTNAQILIKSVSTTGNSQLYFGDGDFDTAGNIIYRHLDNSMAFENSGVERMRITSSGNVGIGTTSPSAKLEVLGGSGAIAGTGLLYANNTDDAFSLVINNAGTSTQNDRGVFDARVGGSSVMRINNSGNVGIGTTNPLSKIHIENTSGNDGIRIINSTTGEGYIVFGDTADSNTGAIAYNHTSDAMTFDVNNSERMRIDSNGRVGIGKTPSTEKLEVNGAIVWQGALTTSQTSAGVLDRSGNDLRIRAYGATAGSGQLVFRTGGGGGSVDSEAMRITSSGVVQVRNQTPTIQLYNTDDGVELNQTLGDIDWYQIDPSDQGVGTVAKIRAVNASTFAGYGELAFHTGSATSIDERVRIDYQGNVGIGTTSPSAELHIKGAGEILRLETTAARGSGSNTINFDDPTGNKGYLGYGSGLNDTMFIWQRMSEPILFGANNTERMRITSGGNVLIGTTELRPDSANNSGFSFNNFGKSYVFSTSDFGVYKSSTTGNKIFFRYGTSGAVSTTIGSIEYDSTSSVAYNTSSDYRLKEDLQDFDGLSIINNMKVYDFKWKDDKKRSYGVIAHELQEVMPNVVSGQKDAEEMQAVDYSKIVPALVKAIQQQQAEIETLKSQINN
jgi:hypothetical protein